MRTTLYALLAAVMAGVMAAPAAAGGPTVCRFTTDLTASPGFSAAGSSGTSNSDGETGTIECDGWVDGKQPTGPGTFGLTGRYGTDGPDTCTSGGEGDGLQTFTIPTQQGDVKMTNRFTFSYEETGNRTISGRFYGEQLTGTFEMIPVKGDCAKQAITRIAIRGEGTLRGAWVPSGGERCGGSAASA